MASWIAECDCGWSFLAITKTDAETMKRKHEDDNEGHYVYVSAA